MDDLFKSMQMFSQGVKELQFSNALREANSQVQQVKQSALKEEEQRAQLGQIANNLTTYMAQIGTPATTMQVIAGAMGPKRYSNPGEAAMEAALSGDQRLMKAAQNADMAAQTGNMAQLGMQQKFQANENALNRQNALMLKAMDVGSSQKQSQGDLEFNTNVKSALVGLKDLEQTVKRAGNWEMWNEGDKAKLEQASYDLAIKYAKIVDPASVAREGEVAAAQKYLIPMGLTTRNSVTLANIKEFRNKIQEQVKARSSSKPGAAPEAQAPQQNAPAWSQFVRK